MKVIPEPIHTPIVRFTAIAGDPSTVANGEIWYNSVTGKMRKRQSGLTTNWDDFPPISQSVNGLATGATLVGTSENSSRRFYPTAVLFAITAVTGTIVGVATVSLGTNSSSYNNIVTASALTGMTAVNTMLRFAVGAAVANSIAPNSGIYCNVSVAATGVALSVVSILTVLEGYYL